MGNYTFFLMFENPRRSRQARNITENDPKILDLKSSSEQIIFRKLPLGAPDILASRVIIQKFLVFVEIWKILGNICSLEQLFYQKKSLGAPVS